MGSQNRGIVGKSQSVLIMINPIISTRTRIVHAPRHCRGGGDEAARAPSPAHAAASSAARSLAAAHCAQPSQTQVN
jgi:hypothetical protein